MRAQVNLAVVMHFSIDPERLEVVVREAREALIAGGLHDQVGLQGVYLAIEDDAEAIMGMFNR